MDSNDKWVWADESDSSPVTLPLLDEKLTPIVEWPDIEPDPPVPAVIAQPSDSKPAEVPAPPSVPELPPAPEMPPAHGRRDFSATSLARFGA